MPFHFNRLFTRPIWLKVHIYLALIFGFFFALIGVTGSLSVYRDQIDTFFNSDLFIEQPQAQALPLDKILARIRKTHPNRHGTWTLEMPRTENGVITAWFEKPHESFDKFYAPLMVAIDPYTGHVISSRFWGRTLTTWILDLHTHLQMGANGRNIMAGLAILLFISVSSGLYLWWPGIQRLSKAFQLRHDDGLMRFLMDTHRLVGLFSAGFLLLLAFTGFHLAYPQLLEELTASEGMGHGDSGPNVLSTAIPNDRPVSLTEALVIARGLFPSSEVRRITTPLGEQGTYKINLRQKRELNQHHPFTTVWVDRWSGQIRAVNNPSQFSAAQTFTTWQWPLHTGEAFGEYARLIWFFVGLTPLALWMSGLSYWLFRRGLIQDRSIDLNRLPTNTATRLYGVLKHYGRWFAYKLRLYLNGLIYILRLTIRQLKG